MSYPVEITGGQNFGERQLESLISLPIGRRCSSENRAWTVSLFVTVNISRRQFGATIENF